MARVLIIGDTHCPGMRQGYVDFLRRVADDRQRFDLISPIGLRRLSETYAEGAAMYGDRNWENGFPASVVINHALRHLILWLDGDMTEDHLAHAAWNLFALMHFEELRPEVIDIPARLPEPDELE